MGIFTVSKTQVFIAPAVTAEPASASAYAALTWTEIKRVQNPGDIGDQFSDVTVDEVGNGRTQHLKGQADGGTMQLVCFMDDTDAGQTALVAAANDASTADYPIKVVYPNKQNATGTGGVAYFLGKVMSKRTVTGTANTVTTRNFAIGVTTKITEVASTAGA